SAVRGEPDRGFPGCPRADSGPPRATRLARALSGQRPPVRRSDRIAARVGEASRRLVRVRDRLGRGPQTAAATWRRAADWPTLTLPMPEKTESRIALFVDFENLVTNTGLTAANFDLQPELDRLLERGKVVFRRAYCDWSRFREAKGTLHELGFELVDVPPSTRAGKN